MSKRKAVLMYFMTLFDNIVYIRVLYGSEIRLHLQIRRFHDYMYVIHVCNTCIIAWEKGKII